MEVWSFHNCPRNKSQVFRCPMWQGLSLSLSDSIFKYASSPVMSLYAVTCSLFYSVNVSNVAMYLVQRGFRRVKSPYGVVSEWICLVSTRQGEATLKSVRLVAEASQFVGHSSQTHWVRWLNKTMTITYSMAGTCWDHLCFGLRSFVGIPGQVGSTITWWGVSSCTSDKSVVAWEWWIELPSWNGKCRRIRRARTGESLRRVFAISCYFYML